jgi:hypothetical protein
VFLAICGAAEPFLLYALFNFVEDAKRTVNIDSAPKGKISIWLTNLDLTSFGASLS